MLMKQRGFLAGFVSLTGGKKKKIKLFRASAYIDLDHIGFSEVISSSQNLFQHADF